MTTTRWHAPDTRTWSAPPVVCWHCGRDLVPVTGGNGFWHLPPHLPYREAPPGSAPCAGSTRPVGPVI